MTRWHSRLELEQQVKERLARGATQRQIAKVMGISRGLVQRIEKAHRATRSEPALASSSPSAPTSERPPPAPRKSKLDPYLPRLGELLKAYPSITAERIYEELREAGYDGGRTIIKDRVALLRPPPPPTPSRVRPEAGPGAEGEQDWSPHAIPFVDGTTRTVHAFLLVLSYSRRRYLDFFEHVDQFALLEGHRRAFDFFGGVPGAIRYDRQSAVVARREGPDVIYQPRLLAFSTHYGFEPRAVRPYHPNDKAFVERDLWDVERSFLNGRRFRDLDDLRAQARAWLTRIVDERRHPAQRDRRVIDVFEEERVQLRPPPTHPFDTARLVYRLVSIDGFVAWDGNRYSVPYAHVTALCPVRITQEKLFVYGPDLAAVAEHALLPRGAGRQSVIAAHRPPRPDGPGAHLAQIRDPFCALCEQAADYLEGLICAHPRSAAYHARRILELRERYSAADVATALRHALEFQAFSFTALTRIVEARARPRTLDEYVAERTEDKLRHVLRDERLRPRDLGTYDRRALPPTAGVIASAPLAAPPQELIPSESAATDPAPPPEAPTATDSSTQTKETSCPPAIPHPTKPTSEST
jgi:transposase